MAGAQSSSFLSTRLSLLLCPLSLSDFRDRMTHADTHDTCRTRKPLVDVNSVTVVVLVGAVWGGLPSATARIARVSLGKRFAKKTMSR